jgi:hypothetical protein
MAEARIQGEEVLVTWEHDEPGDVFRWVVYREIDGSWDYEIFARNDRRATLPLFAPLEPDSATVEPELDMPEEAQPRVSVIAVTAVDRTGNESAWTRIVLGG